MLSQFKRRTGISRGQIAHKKPYLINYFLLLIREKHTSYTIPDNTQVIPLHRHTIRVTPSDLGVAEVGRLLLIQEGLITQDIINCFHFLFW